jgi:hypothetical protein
MRLIARTVPIALCLVALAGCQHSPAFLRTHQATAAPCVDHPVYLAATTVASLRTPEGLVPPNTKNSLKIGEASAPAQARTTKQGCLDKPPTFFGEQAKPPVGPTEKPVPPEKLAPKSE